MRVLDKIKKEEGFRARMYDCPSGKKTVGYGINLEATPIPEPVADHWLRHEIDGIRNELVQHEWFNAMSIQRQGVIIDMAYNMGVVGVLGFRRMIMALSAHDYETAAREMLDSQYARQVPNRAQRNAESLITGVLQ